MMQKAFLFYCMLSSLFVTAQTKNYLLFDAKHMKSMIYGNVGQDVNNRTYTYFVGNEHNEAYLETGARETVTFSKLPKGTLQYAGYNWDAQLAQQINSGKYKMHLLIPQGNNKYISTPVRFVTNVQKNGNIWAFTAHDYAFTAHFDGNMACDENLAPAGSHNYIFFNNQTAEQCLPKYTFRREPDEVCIATTIMDYIPGLGIVQEQSAYSSGANYEPIRLLTINGKSLNDYAATLCDAKTNAEGATLAVLDHGSAETILVGTSHTTTTSTYIAKPIAHAATTETPKIIKKTTATTKTSQTTAKGVQSTKKAIAIGKPKKEAPNKAAEKTIATYHQPKTTAVTPKTTIAAAKSKTTKTTTATTSPKTTKPKEKPKAEEMQPVMASTSSSKQVITTPKPTTKIVIAEETAKPQGTQPTALATTTQTITTSACPEAPGRGYHIVQRGESPYAIAKAYGVDYVELMKLNKIVDPTLIPICHKLWIENPPAGVVIQEQMLPATYANNKTGGKNTTVIVAKQWDQLENTPATYSTSTLPSTYNTATTTAEETSRTSTEQIIVPQPEEVSIADVVYTEKEVQPTVIAAAPSIIHSVKEGETLYSIATYYGYTVERFAVMNGLRLDAKLYPGMQLTASDNTCKIDLDAPQPTTTTSSTPKGVIYKEPAVYNTATNATTKRTSVFAEQPITHSIDANSTDKYKYSSSGAGEIRTHIVATGETLASIASFYGVSVEKLYQWNKMEKTETIIAGQTLIVKR